MSATRGRRLRRRSAATPSALGLQGIFLMTTLLGVTNLWVAVLSDTGATAPAPLPGTQD